MSYKDYLEDKGLYMQRDPAQYTTEKLLDMKTRLENELKLLFKAGKDSMQTTLDKINRELEQRHAA